MPACAGTQRRLNGAIRSDPKWAFLPIDPPEQIVDRILAAIDIGQPALIQIKNGLWPIASAAPDALALL